MVTNLYLGRYWFWVWIWKWRSWIWRRGTSKSSKGNATVRRDFGKWHDFLDQNLKIYILDKNPCPKPKTISRSGFISSNFNTENTQNKSFASWYARGKSCRVLLGFCTSSVSWKSGEIAKKRRFYSVSTCAATLNIEFWINTLLERDTTPG